VQIGDPTFHHVESSVVIKFECANEWLNQEVTVIKFFGQFSWHQIPFVTHDSAPVECSPLEVIINLVSTVLVSWLKDINQFCSSYALTGLLFVKPKININILWRKFIMIPQATGIVAEKNLNNTSCLLDLSWNSIIPFMILFVAWPRDLFPVIMVTANKKHWKHLSLSHTLPV
jgi:hypothetical protein